VEIEQYTRLKKSVDDLRRRRDKAEGAFEQSLQRLKETIGVESEDEARRKLEELVEKAGRIERQYKLALRRFLEKWGEKLGIGVD